MNRTNYQFKQQQRCEICVMQDVQCRTCKHQQHRQSCMAGQARAAAKPRQLTITEYNLLDSKRGDDGLLPTFLQYNAMKGVSRVLSEIWPTW